jgi:hypothetical protein
VFFADPVNF